MVQHIFISYQHDDSDFAELLIQRVEKAGFVTWIDNGQLHAGDDWRATIDQAIQEAHAIIVIMSPQAKASEYVTYEWAFAWGAGVKVIPVLYKQTPLHPRLEALQYLNFTQRDLRPWDTLIKTLQTITTATSKASLNGKESTPLISNTIQQTTESWLRTGQLLYEREDYHSALDAYKQAILLNLNSASAYVGKGKAHFQLKQYKEALTSSEQAIRLDPNLAEACTSKVDALNALRRYEEALTSSEQAIRLDPNLAEAYNGKGDALYYLERYEDALVAFDQALHLEPDNAAYYKNKGVVLYYGLNRYEDALVAFDQALRLKPDNAAYYNYKGNTLYYGLNRYEDALVAYNQALRLEPDNAAYYNNKGTVFHQMKRNEEATANFSKAKQLGYSN